MCNCENEVLEQIEELEHTVLEDLGELETVTVEATYEKRFCPDCGNTSFWIADDEDGEPVAWGCSESECGYVED